MSANHLSKLAIYTNVGGRQQQPLKSEILRYCSTGLWIRNRVNGNVRLNVKQKNERARLGLRRKAKENGPLPPWSDAPTTSDLASTDPRWTRATGFSDFLRTYIFPILARYTLVVDSCIDDFSSLVISTAFFLEFPEIISTRIKQKWYKKQKNYVNCFINHVTGRRDEQMSRRTLSIRPSKEIVRSLFNQ